MLDKCCNMSCLLLCGSEHTLPMMLIQYQMMGCLLSEVRKLKTQSVISPLLVALWLLPSNSKIRKWLSALSCLVSSHMQRTALNSWQMLMNDEWMLFRHKFETSISSPVALLLLIDSFYNANFIDSSNHVCTYYMCVCNIVCWMNYLWGHVNTMLLIWEECLAFQI